MASFQEIADKKKKDQMKFSKPGFSKAPTNRAIGGASPVSVASLQKIEDIEDQIDAAGSGGKTLGQRMDDIEQANSGAATDISQLDALIVHLGQQSNELSLRTGAVEADTRDKADATHTHPDLYLNSEQVRNLVLQLLGDTDLDTIPPGGSSFRPNILAGQYGYNVAYHEGWSDNFTDSSATTLFDRWQPDLMTEGLHQAGNQGRANWRWSSNYSQPTETSFIKDNALHMRAVVEEMNNPYRTPYTYRGVTQHPEDYWIYNSFLTTWARKWDNTANGFITDPNAPDRTWGPGTVFEFEVDLTEMRTQACRISFYLLPAYENDSNSYDPNGPNGVEVDIGEIDFLNGYENAVQAKVLSGRSGGDTPAGTIYVDNFISDADLTTGTHTLTLIWQKDKLVWYVDGVEVQRETDPRRIPQSPHYMVISREANSGIKPQRKDGILDDGESTYSNGTDEQPVDVGIWARPVYAEIDNLHNDVAKINRFNTWYFTDNSIAASGTGDDSSGISPSITSPNPEASFAADQSHTFTWDANGRVVSDWYLELGSKRGANDLGSRFINGDNRLAVMPSPGVYNGPVNARLWFRENALSPWHWRDYGLGSGLQSYWIGTDGKPRVAVPSGTYVPSVPTEIGGVSNGRDGTVGSNTDYAGGVVPASYTDTYVPPTTGTVGLPPPTYSGGATLQSLPVSPGLTFSQYPNITGDLLWNAPAEGIDALDIYEVVINNVVVYRGQGNSFFVDYLDESTNNIATARLVRDDGSYGNALTLSFDMVEL